ncbi:MAG: VanZ family protein [Betaproteobacteria bacterium]|nr:VanZ family protein [Betaproteobacteria bacterium]
MRGSPLARLLLAVYALLVVYASLYPLAGWRDHGLSALEFLIAPWPRYVVAFDVAADVVGYAVLGLLIALALHPRLRGANAVAVATLAGAALSIALEATQTYLPVRVASNVDVLCNTAGAMAGALAGRLFAAWVPAFGGWRARLFLPGIQADVGLALLGLWVFMQLNPATLLFGSGDLRHLLAGPPGTARAPEFFVAIEAVTAAANLAAAALLASAVAAPRAPVRRLILLLVLAALAVKTLAFTIILRAQDSFAWLTPGALQGLATGLTVALIAVSLPRVARLAAAAVLFMAATVLVNFAPPNPYLAEILKLWQQGHFLNFNGLTRLVSLLWPFAAIGYLIVLAARRRDEALL